MHTTVLGANQRHYLSQGDIKGRCPHCGTDNVVVIGKLSIAGADHQVCKCNHCNTLHGGVDGGVRSLVEEAKEVFRTENVGFTLVATDGTQINSTGVIPDPYNAEELVRTNDSIKNEVQQLRYELQNLTQVIREMATQNHDLMEKLMTDPLNGMRKAVSNFNLE